MLMDKTNYTIDDLVNIVDILRSPNGCPWDIKQTHKSIRNNMLEEAYEAAEAIDNDDTNLLKEELGDVLLQIVMHSQFEKEKDSFTFDDVCDGICKKLIFRHPHVFGEKKVDSPEDALASWESMKKKEKNQTTKTDSLIQLSKALPALMYTQKLQKRAANFGFDYTDLVQAFTHLKKEIEELESAIKEDDKINAYEEMGDVLFSAVNVSRFLNIDSEQALFDSNAKFVGRFYIVEQIANERGIDLTKADLFVLNNLWEEAKKIQKEQIFGGSIK